MLRKKGKKRKMPPVQPIFFAIFFAFFILIFAFFFLALRFLHPGKRIGRTYFRSAEARGKFGENVVRGIIDQASYGQQYMINDLRLRLPNGMSAQIDHVVIRPNGIFVIETKNYSGTIYGGQNDRQWTQVLAGGKEKHKMYNPIKQNATHLYHVNRILHGKYALLSAIVFVQGNTENILADQIFSQRELLTFLRSDTGQKLTEEEVQSVFTLLSQHNAGQTLSASEHIQNIRRMETDLQNNICPRCKGKLVQRCSKDGNLFLGCSNYPDCRFTKRR